MIVESLSCANIVTRSTSLKRSFMKRIVSLLSAAIFFTMISCTNEPAETKKEKEVIVVPETKKEEPKPTSISVDKKGVEVESKKVKVKVKPNE